MRDINYIPKTKIARASKLVETGIKVGGNYLKYYGNQITGNPKAQEQLDKDNASDIYDGLKTMKGSALKVAQMLSMEKNLLPRAYVEQFSLSQFSVPLYPLLLFVKVSKNTLANILRKYSIISRRSPDSLQVSDKFTKQNSKKKN